MDYLAHGFWSYIFFHRIKKPFYAVFFGLMPDNLSWVIYLFYRMIKMEYIPGPPQVDAIPQFFFTLYGISHSLIVFGFVAVIIYLIFKRIPVYIYAWPIAIIIDLLTHTREFLPTPFLWPISKWTFPGISWGDGTFLTINYTLIFICLLAIAIRHIIIKKKIMKKKAKIIKTKNSK